MMEIVSIMDCMPPLLSNRSRSSMPVALVTPVLATSTIVAKSIPCKATASTIPMAMATRNDGMAGTFKAMHTIIAKRGMSVSGPMS